jgi:uncharacterized phage protein gp47/JayE
MPPTTSSTTPTLNLLTYEALLKTMSQVFVQLSGVTDLTDLSVATSFLEAASLSDYITQASIIAALNSIDIDRAEDSDLDNIGLAAGISRPQAQPATGNVNFFSTNFNTIQTNIYAGTAAPAAGSMVINVADASLFPATGSVYIGSGSNSLEGPIAYTSISTIGNFYAINLSAPTAKNHNVNQSVLLAQGGNRVIPAGTTVQTSANATSAAVQYTTLIDATIPDGQSTLTGVPVVCTQVGSVGNQPANAINQFSGVPFQYAGVTNPNPFITGQDQMSDPDYRLLIKNYEQTREGGTPLAIETAAVGVTSTDDNQTVASASFLQPSNRNQPGILYIDNGNGYEPIFEGQGFEQVITSANGGEVYFQLQNEDITKALLVSSFTTPFQLTGGMSLSIKVGGVLSEHIFSNTDFATQNAANTFEIINSVNSNTSLLYSARALNNGTQVVFFANSYVNEDLQVVTPTDDTIDANQYLGLDTNLTYTLRLYKNNKLLIKDGLIPEISTEPQSNWGSIFQGDTLTLAIDQQSSPLTYTFNNVDFVPYGFNSVSQLNPLTAWASVFNSKIPGIQATVQGAELAITSNLGANNNAKLAISGGTLLSKMFGSSVPITSIGVSSDYALNRATGQLQLTVPLVAGDNLTAGSKNTRGFITSTSIASGTISLPGTPQAPQMWVLLDDVLAQSIANTASAGSQITITNPATNLWEVTSNQAEAFALVEPGDWVVMADDAIYSISPNFIGHWKVASANATSFQFYMTQSLGATGGPVTLLDNNKINFIRSALGTVQKFVLPSGLNNLSALAISINSQFNGGFASVVSGSFITLTSNTYGLNGALIYCGNTPEADLLGFAVGTMGISSVSHTAFDESSQSELTMPDFVFDSVATGTAAIPPAAIMSTQNWLAQGYSPDSLICFLDPYTNISSNKGVFTQVANLATGDVIDLRPEGRLDDVIAGDRFFLGQPYTFDSDDNLVVIMDQNPTYEAVSINIARQGVISNVQTPSQNTFTAYDAAAGPTANYANQFGNNFSFADFKIYLQARQVITPAGSNNQFLVQSVNYGPDGNNLEFSLEYPTAPNSPLESSVVFGLATDMTVYLASGVQRLGSTYDSTTQFDVSSPSSNVWRYTWNGTGSAPNFTSANIQPGDIVNIAVTSNFAADNTGIFQIVDVSNNYFDITAFDGVTQNNIQLNNASEIIFYALNASANTATLIGTYINANLDQYITATQLTSGGGVISTSTWDDSMGTMEYLQLDDGVNWILSSNIGTTVSPTNQFTLKQNFVISASNPNYGLVNRTFYLIPTRTAQLVRFLNVFAVSGLSSIANLAASSDGHKLEIYSNNFGSAGAVQISGGSANQALALLLTSGAALSAATIDATPSGLTASGTTVTVQTTGRHGLSVGELVVISNADNSAFDGRYVVTAVTPRTFQYTYAPPTITIATVSRSANIVTVTTTAPNTLGVGDIITIAGVTDSSYDGTFPVATVGSTTVFSYTQVGADSTSTGGSVVDISSGGGEVELPYGVVTIPYTERQGFHTGQYVEFINQSTMPKVTGINATTQIALSGSQASIAGGSGTFQTIHAYTGDATTQMRFERQAQFVCVSWTGVGTNPNISTNIIEGDWVVISGAANLSNQGTFKVMKVYNNSFYILNQQVVEQDVTLSANSDMAFYAYDSVMPGDQLLISSNILGTLNMGTYTVVSSPFPTSTTINVSVNFPQAISATLLGVAYNSFNIIEKAPYVAYKKIVNLAQDPDNSAGLAITFDGDRLAGKLSTSASAQVSVVGKLNFPTVVEIGEDSYKHYEGLIHAVGEVIRGEAYDTVTYPGVAAAGSFIEITAPLPLTLSISIIIQLVSNVPFSTVQSSIQSAVAAYVNSLGVGQSVSFSEVVATVQQINGVTALAISAPTYNTTDLVIVVNQNEKALINASNVIVSLASS